MRLGFSTIIGAYLGRFIANPQALGLEFAVVAMFIGLYLSADN